MNNRTARHKARELALQAIYQWQHTGYSASKIIHFFEEEENFGQIDREYFEELVRGVIEQVSTLDETFTPYLDRDINALNPIEVAVIRLAVYELINRLDIPFKVVINEALELTKTFGSVEGFKYVNGVLDKTARQLRSAEIK